MAKWQIVEKKNPNAVHAICSTIESAENWINETMPEYVKRGYYDDKTLTVDSFMIQEQRNRV